VGGGGFAGGGVQRKTGLAMSGRGGWATAGSPQTHTHTKPQIRDGRPSVASPPPPPPPTHTPHFSTHFPSHGDTPAHSGRRLDGVSTTHLQPRSHVRRRDRQARDRGQAVRVHHRQRHLVKHPQARGVGQLPSPRLLPQLRVAGAGVHAGRGRRRGVAAPAPRRAACAAAAAPARRCGVRRAAPGPPGPPRGGPRVAARAHAARRAGAAAGAPPPGPGRCRGRGSAGGRGRRVLHRGHEHAAVGGAGQGQAQLHGPGGAGAGRAARHLRHSPRRGAQVAGAAPKVRRCAGFGEGKGV
jgi:hypothetical protein